MKKLVSLEDLAADVANLHCRKPADAYPLLCRLLTWVARQTREQTIRDVWQSVADAILQQHHEHRLVARRQLLNEIFGPVGLKGGEPLTPKVDDDEIPF